MANANLIYARQQFGRTSQLTAAGFASRQDLDKATTAVETGSANLLRAKERYEAARLGPTREEREIADAKVEAAAAAVSVIAARAGKLWVLAPADGTLALLAAEPGEAIVPDEPLMTLQPSGRNWASFNLREDQLGDLRIGPPVTLSLTMIACRSIPGSAKSSRAANSPPGARLVPSATMTSTRFWFAPTRLVFPTRFNPGCRSG